MLAHPAGVQSGDFVTAVPEIRIRNLNEAPVRPDGDYVLYWMIALRRLGRDFAPRRAAGAAAAGARPAAVGRVTMSAPGWSASAAWAGIPPGGGRRGGRVSSGGRWSSS